MAGDASDVQKQDRLAGLLLMAAAAIALLLANSSLAHGYHTILEARVGPPMPRF
jgi:Na+:H+ antiporter, NhaA family